jgi:hypothetical protein
MCKENRHCLIWTWISGRYVLACIISGCGYVVKREGGKRA